MTDQEKKIAYTVKCRIRHEEKVSAWISWLENGHIDDVIKGGAESGRIVMLDRDGDDYAADLEVQYVFPSRPVFDAYVENHAPALREEGLQKFPPEEGFEYSRTIGEIL